MSLSRDPGAAAQVVGHPCRAAAGRRPGTRSSAHGRLGGIDPAELAARFGTPFYAYDLDVVARQVAALEAVLPTPFDLAYAVKANPNLAVLRHLAGAGLGADVASGGELRHALRAGFAAERIVFTGPGKRDEELRRRGGGGRARRDGRDRVGELRRLAGIAEGLGRRQPILLRGGRRPRRLGSSASGSSATTGRASSGWTPPTCGRGRGEAVASPWLEPLGVHAFGASNVLDAGALVAHVEATVGLAVELAAAAGFELRLVDAGGGLGIPYEVHEEPLDLGRLGARLEGDRRRLAADPATRDTRVLLEPGRFLVGPAGAYVAPGRRSQERRRAATS